MPKRRERAAGYIRESDPTLANSTTIDSQAKAVRLHCQKEGYDYTDNYEYREAISAYLVPYIQRPQLMEMLKAAKRGEFDVLVLSEIRALSRRQVEVFIIYDLLQKYGVRLETIQEKFEDSAMGRLILSLRSFVAEVERENTYMRMERGKKDRLEDGNINGHPKPAYGYIFIDTEWEVKARYALNETVIYVDSQGTQWTEFKVVIFIFDQFLSGASIRSISFTLTKMGIPSPFNGKGRKGKKFSGCWHPATIHGILTNRMYIGEVVANKYGRVNGKLGKRPAEEHILLPSGIAPAIITKDVFDEVQKRFAVNKQNSLRNNKAPKEELGILRAGYARCGICGRALCVNHRDRVKNSSTKPQYICSQKTGKDDLVHRHWTTIMVYILDHAAWEKAVEVICNPSWVRARVAQLREENKPVVNVEDIKATIENIRRQMHNLYQLAKLATDDESIETLGGIMKDLERQKREAEGKLLDLDEDTEERAEVEAEIVKFERWIEQVQPLLTDPGYTPSYEEQRLAVRILGIQATVFPQSGDYPFRYQIEVTIPEIIAKMKSCVSNDWSSCSSYTSGLASAFPTQGVGAFSRLYRSS